MKGILLKLVNKEVINNMQGARCAFQQQFNDALRKIYVTEMTKSLDRVSKMVWSLVWKVRFHRQVIF